MVIGEPSAVFDVVNKEGLLEFFDMSLNFQKIFTFWSVVGGNSITWISAFGMNQVMVQRYCGLASIRKARTALYINTLGVSSILTISSLCGLLLFALYHRCDPLKAAMITKYDQLMPHFVMETLGHLPGITGLFVAAVYSGSLSTLSSGYNALAAIVWEDFIKHICETLSQRCHVGNEGNRCRFWSHRGGPGVPLREPAILSYRVAGNPKSAGANGAAYRSTAAAVANRDIKPGNAHYDGAGATNVGDKVTWREYAPGQPPPTEPSR
ncbi:hypothetical protein MRX96_056290 [Rhipicephalus microplus]